MPSFWNSVPFGTLVKRSYTAGWLTIKKPLSYPEVQSILSFLFTASHSKLPAEKKCTLLKLSRVWFRHERVSDGRTNTWPGSLSLTWDRFQCGPLWCHKGPHSRTVCYNALTVGPNNEVKSGLFLFLWRPRMHGIVGEHCFISCWTFIPDPCENIPTTEL